MKWHPDKNPGNEETAKVAFQKVNAAYQRLTTEGDTDSDSEEIFTAADNFEAAAAFFMHMMREMREMGEGGVFFELGGGFGFMGGASFGPSSAPRGAAGRGPGFGSARGAGRGRSKPAHTFFEEVSDDDNDSYNSEEDSEDPDYGYYKAQEKRETARQQAEQRDRQKRAEELRARQQERQKLSEEDRRKNEERIEAEARARAQAQEEEVLYKVISQMPRPTMAERTETSVTLSMARLAKATGGSQLPKGCLWEMEMRLQSDSVWRSIHSSTSTGPVTANDLLPGTKYVFRARGGRKLPDGSMEWGKYSEESFYATMGRSQAPAGQAAGQAAESAGQPGQSKKGRRRDAAAAASKKLQPHKSEEVDLDEAKRRLRAEKEKEAAVKAAMDRAAEDYRRETERLAAQKAKTEEMVAEKVRRSRMKARKKEEAVQPPPPKEDGAHGTNEQAAAPAPPPQQTYRPPLPLRSTSGLNNYSDAFGDVRRINPEQPGSNTAGGGWDMMVEEEMSLQEAIQLTLALEESERYAKEEAANRSKLRFTEQSFPSLGGNAGDNGGEWEAWEDPDPPAPPPQKAALPPPSQPAYRESKRPAPAQGTSDSVSSMYASGNRRMAPPQPAYAPAPAPVRPHAEPPRTSGSGVYTEEDVVRQVRAPPPAAQPNGYGPPGFPNGHANGHKAPTQRPVPNGQVPARQPYNPLNSAPQQPQSAAASYAPPASQQLPRGNAATPMAALFPHLFPNTAT
ncbi:hypothetical protein COCSUDRAFT_66228 [Coccomyxa subellipsoidea C-169]|uniref:J domain-containing protein n=1 Tax=Coccomyxa subellipsoidea (strain C-169) TaxID=574566 RepID=I0YXV4_COCSC|nr:hypothetical protein COCSUDRAFT_66228 [Coccomyxa subellipsoidea C-169]EIE23223.1 hypothetical protein COCSUDRAFT_66228 [Coccomyxa subellipsoidea C-169]|eukprot:XP_005647767.1 hypothetical protein COCSUDRAFT_66228 [Coccomyxa subellipsoidea C-169]